MEKHHEKLFIRTINEDIPKEGGFLLRFYIREAKEMLDCLYFTDEEEEQSFIQSLTGNPQKAFSILVKRLRDNEFYKKLLRLITVGIEEHIDYYRRDGERWVDSLLRLESGGGGDHKYIDICRESVRASDISKEKI